MKLTTEILEAASQYINPATRDRELDLRGYKISVIENLGATMDQFDSIDFSDNDIRRLDGFPLLNRLKKLILNNNRISRIGEQLEECIPNLDWLILTNNQIQELGDIDPLSGLTKLEFLTLLNNPVTTKKHYRLYVIHKLPALRILDFRKVKQKEREEATNLFKGKKGKQLEKEIGVKSKTFTPGVGDIRQGLPGYGRPLPSPQDVEAIKAAIAKAQTLEEIERLQQLLKAGYVPGRTDYQIQRRGNQMVEEEEDGMQNFARNGR
ncbi:U2 small nuclear ribonucleoprotein A'-like protein [Leptotrombidium deliense]|uniref:Probable U2 small nuclear ribonucleoprotein A' n=1 Tax=Leptotrombidium deliense TaxID=299467 RepID=A0A443RZQ7_9ACAR|nr:U2 small nuclear ribonucleoprotein A'-like protein [Leptotrombidium deliense]